MNVTQQVGKKFYFFDYFYILLKSVSSYTSRETIFDSFKILKQKFSLGESKYKKLTIEGEDLTEKQLRRYEYTFQQVITESIDYNLLQMEGSRFIITDKGIEALSLYLKDKHEFNKYIFVLMEEKLYAFYDLIRLCYKENQEKNGLLIFPIYSPRKLGFDKTEMTTNKHIFQYSRELTQRLASDIKKYTGKNIDLEKEEKKLLTKLVEDKLLTKNVDDTYEQDKYNLIITRFRKFWLNYFLQDVYNYKHSFDTFNIWVERGKQLGIIHTTEFYPGFDGRLVYPTSIIIKEVKSKDFELIYTYKNKDKLFIHRPKWNLQEKNRTNEAQENFIKALVESYFDLRKSRRTHFIRLHDLREKVCYKTRIPSFVFDEFLEKTYITNLKGEMELQIQISLESDRLPQETNAMYLKREPILVNGKYKNIIAIDYKKNLYGEHS